jgi:hypothetical protein
MALRKMLDSCGRTALVVAGSLNTWTEDIRENTRIFTCSFVVRPINKYMILKTLKCLWLTISHFRPSTSGTWVQLNPQAEKRNRNGSHSKAAAIAWEMVPSENISEFISLWFSMIFVKPLLWSIEICKLPSIDWLQLGLSAHVVPESQWIIMIFPLEVATFGYIYPQWGYYIPRVLYIII